MELFLSPPTLLGQGENWWWKWLTNWRCGLRTGGDKLCVVVIAKHSKTIMVIHALYSKTFEQLFKCFTFTTTQIFTQLVYNPFSPPFFAPCGEKVDSETPQISDTKYFSYSSDHQLNGHNFSNLYTKSANSVVPWLDGSHEPTLPLHHTITCL